MGAKKDCVERPTKKEMKKNKKLEEKLKVKESKDKKEIKELLQKAKEKKKESQKFDKLYKKDGDHLYNYAVKDRHEFLAIKHEIKVEENELNNLHNHILGVQNKGNQMENHYDILHHNFGNKARGEDIPYVLSHHEFILPVINPQVLKIVKINTNPNISREKKEENLKPIPMY